MANWTQSPEPSTAEAFATVRRGWQLMEALEVPAGHSGDEESGHHDEDCALCAHEALLAWSEEAAHALAMLERRAGAQDNALVRAAAELRHAYRAREDWNLVSRAIQILERAALADAPPVFTLERIKAEVEAAVAFWVGEAKAETVAQDVERRLTGRK